MDILIIILISGYISGSLALASMEDFQKWYQFIKYFIFYILTLWFLWFILLLIWRTDYGNGYFDN